MIAMKLSEIACAMGADLVGGSVHESIIVRRITTDSRNLQPGDLFVAIRGDRFDGHAYMSQAETGGAVACVSDSAGLRHAASIGQTVQGPVLVVEDTITALGDLAAHYRRKHIPVGMTIVAVTGSNGKTTTKEMLDHVLGGSLCGRASIKSYNNHIGVPLTLLSAEADDRYLIVEVGSNSPGEIEMLTEIVAPHVAVITSIGEAHLEGLGDLQSVAAEKTSIMDHVLEGGLAVVNVDRPEIRPFLEKYPTLRIFTVGQSPYAQLSVANASSSIEKTTFELEGRFQIELPMPGTHHATNAAAAFAVARWFGVAVEDIVSSLSTFSPPEGRTHRIEAGGVTVIDDAYNANPSSVLAAIDALTGGTTSRKVFVLGDMLELGGEASECHDRVVRAAMAAGVDVLVAVGKRTLKAATHLSPNIGRAMVVSCVDTDTAVELVDDIVTSGDTVWVKGSRAMQLDRVVSRLSRRISKPVSVV
jgi:UDP-N-acetylmuramoyl-tripeptide--D-alanyl-D-alanine ligase